MSYHMIVSIPIFLSDDMIDTKVEIQIRTIAMDFWASLEHKIYYKFEGKAPEGIRDELRECAQIISFLDQKMLSINEGVNHYHENFNGGTAMTSNVNIIEQEEERDKKVPDSLRPLFGSIAAE